MGEFAGERVVKGVWGVRGVGGDVNGGVKRRGGGGGVEGRWDGMDGMDGRVSLVESVSSVRFEEPTMVGILSSVSFGEHISRWNTSSWRSMY